MDNFDLASHLLVHRTQLIRDRLKRHPLPRPKAHYKYAYEVLDREINECLKFIQQLVEQLAVNDATIYIQGEHIRLLRDNDDYRPLSTN